VEIHSSTLAETSLSTLDLVMTMAGDISRYATQDPARPSARVSPPSSMTYGSTGGPGVLIWVKSPKASDSIFF
jgi:hypothetical protein